MVTRNFCVNKYMVMALNDQTNLGAFTLDDFSISNTKNTRCLPALLAFAYVALLELGLCRACKFAVFVQGMSFLRVSPVGHLVFLPH